jgi:lysyl-tRNA synthetase class 2
MHSESERLGRIKDNLIRRALIFDLTRKFFKDRGYLEVDTPIRCSAIAPEEFIFPEKSGDWFLAASPELHMKRLLAASYDKIFQISRCFRKGERGKLHNPEFTMIEWYAAGSDYMGVMQETQELVYYIAQNLKTGPKLHYQGKDIDISVPWPKMTVRNALKKYAGWDPVSDFDGERFDDDVTFKVIPNVAETKPCILYDYPRQVASLARLKRNNHAVAERAECFIGGLELANAYSELIDAEEQRKRFSEDIKKIKETQNRVMPMPEMFIDAVKDMKPTGGIALGMDRLVMLFCDAASIDEVLAFPSETA